MTQHLNARGLAASAEQLRVLNTPTAAHKPFDDTLQAAGLHPLRAAAIEIFQVNVGKLCNQTCGHRHVGAGPDRREIMTQQTAELAIRALRQTEAHTVDITGGAELAPPFRYLVEESKKLGKHVMDRCNLTVLLVWS